MSGGTGDFQGRENQVNHLMASRVKETLIWTTQDPNRHHKYPDGKKLASLPSQRGLPSPHYVEGWWPAPAVRGPLPQGYSLAAPHLPRSRHLYQKSEQGGILQVIDQTGDKHTLNLPIPRAFETPLRGTSTAGKGHFALHPSGRVAVTVLSSRCVRVDTQPVIRAVFVYVALPEYVHGTQDRCRVSA